MHLQVEFTLPPCMFLLSAVEKLERSTFTVFLIYSYSKTQSSSDLFVSYYVSEQSYFQLDDDAR